jgi:hypothetical protein
MRTVTIGLLFITDTTSSNTSGHATLYKQKQDSIFDEAIHYFLSSAVGIATDYGLDDPGLGVRVPVEARIFTSPCRPDRLWGPPSLLFNGYREPFPQR